MSYSLFFLTVYALVWSTLHKRSEKGEKSLLLKVIRGNFLAYARLTMHIPIQLKFMGHLQCKTLGPVVTKMHTWSLTCMNPAIKNIWDKGRSRTDIPSMHTGGAVSVFKTLK